jgi:HSP20 family molecular chaperone IbpA
MRDDDFFNNPFDDIVREFFGGPVKRVKRQRFQESDEFDESEEENRKTDNIDLGDRIAFIFELLGYDEKDLKLEIKDRTLNIEVKKKKECKMQDYLSKKLCHGEIIKKIKPPYIDIKNFKYSFKNGILEVIFNKK